MIDESSGNEWLMPVRSRGRPRYLIQNRKVSADYAIGLIVVVKAQNGKPVLGGVKDMRIPRFLGQRVNGNAWDFALGKLHGVGTADLVHVHTGHGHVQLLCNENQGAGQLLVRMTGPDFRKRQPKSVHVDHSIGRGHLFQLSTTPSPSETRSKCALTRTFP